MLGLLIRLAVSAFALWVATLPSFDSYSISVDTDSTASRVATFVVVAIIFGIVNAVLKPIIKTIGCAAYLLTLGLVALVVNALLLLLTDWISGLFDIPFEVQNFWPSAVVGALIIGVVSWVASKVTDRD